MSEIDRFSRNSKKMQAIEMLADIACRFKKMKDMAKDLGISERTLRRWRNDKNFQQAVNERIKELFNFADIEIRKMILKKASEGNVPMIKFYYEHVEGWIPPRKRNHHNSYIVAQPTKVVTVFPDGNSVEI